MSPGKTKVMALLRSYESKIKYSRPSPIENITLRNSNNIKLLFLNQSNYLIKISDLYDLYSNISIFNNFFIFRVTDIGRAFRDLTQRFWDFARQNKFVTFTKTDTIFDQINNGNHFISYNLAALHSKIILHLANYFFGH